MACRRDINAIKRRSRGVVRSRWSSRSGCGSSWSAIILLVILLQGGLETLAADDAPARATSATSSQSDIADERPPSVENPFEKISSKWKDILPIDRACLSLIDWWVSQPLFSYLDKPQTYPNFDAFPMQWATYDNIQKRSQRYERMTRNRKDLRKHGGGQLLTEEYDDGTRQGFAVDGEYMILLWQG
ncbi:unnamed protein product [Amoebophrya sp. A25]|nr:unnamed protein product [Amoebophrya sp. A25]|eukprot:GSA25T00019799001.1